MTQAMSPRVSLVLVVGLAVLTATCLTTPMEAQVRSGRRAASPPPAARSAPAARSSAPAARTTAPAARGAAVQTEDGYAAAGRRGAVVAGDEGYAAVGRHGAVAATEDGYARAGRNGAVVAGEEGVAVAGRGGVVVGNRYESYEAWRAVAGVGTAIAVGTMLARPPAAATVVAYGGSSYYYDSGTYYTTAISNGAPAYQVVSPPAGIVISTLPGGCSGINRGGIAYSQCGSTYYQRVSNGYRVVVF